MGLFATREERRIERNMQVRKALTQIRHQIKDNAKYEAGYVEKAKRARKLGWDAQYAFLKKAIKKTAIVRVQLERRLLALESSVQIKEQAEGHFDFAQAMNALSKSVADVFGATDMAKTQVNFERAMAQAESLEARMDMFLEMASDSMFGYETSTEQELVTDADIEKMLSEQVEHEEREGVDEAIERDIQNIQQEIDRHGAASPGTR